MAQFVWGPEFSVGVTEMDDQHVKIIDYINKIDVMNEAAKTGAALDKAAVGRLLEDLIKYTVTHFTQEEQLMASHGYPTLDRHKLIHKQLVDQVKDLKTQFDKQGVAVVPKLHAFLSVWLKSHIVGIDKQYGAHINKKAS